ncbi:MAG: hypothetical protein M4D80_10865 [Myxococcota bacterium]|nr:hypothetical protein [Myxococcota bacterium]
MRHIALVCVLFGCGTARNLGDDTGGGDDDPPRHDASNTDGSNTGGDGGVSDGSVTGGDAGGGNDAPIGVITGGPCLSGQAGQTAYRMRWAAAGSSAYPVYEVNGLPDKSRDKTGAYGYQIGFTASYVDPFLAQGGLQLNSSSFVDIEISTMGISSIQSAKLAIYGRSFNTTASGSFNWQTFDGTGSTPTNAVSNVAPYAWYAGDMTTEISPGDNGVLLRIKAGPNSGSLVVNRIELCLQAN